VTLFKGRLINWSLSTETIQCRAATNLSLTALEVLPGGGWDNLRNMDMGQVMNMSYFQCRTTENSVYLIPDEVFVIPHKVTGVETSSEIISSWLEQTSATALSINGDVSFFSVLNGKFSAESQRMKTHQVKDSSTTTRVQASLSRLHSGLILAQQVKEIGNAIKNNQTRNANYLSEKMVLDYGTHVITSVDAGASLVEEDYLTSTYVSDNNSQSLSVKIMAGLNFFDKIKFDINSDYSQKSSDLRTYQSNIQYSLTESHGGMPFYPGISLQKWQESTKNNLVMMIPVRDQKCTPLSLEAEPLCETLAEKNPQTGDFSCRSPYVTTLLASEEKQKGYNVHECYKEHCQDKYYVCSARIHTYWCSANGQAPDNSGYLFGGIYGPSVLNPITKAKSCPPNFIEQKFFADDQVICMSKDYESATRYAVPFGGMFSCHANNPLAEDQRRCPPKFSQHLPTVSDGCEILYCVQSKAFTDGRLLPIHLPPFIKPPLISIRATNTVMVMTEGDQNWVRVGQAKMWKLAKPEEVQQMVRNLNPEFNGMSSGEKAGVAFGVIGTMALLAIGAVLIKKRRGRQFGFVRGSSYEVLEGRDGQSMG
uniref:Macrophage-expressed gene 1 protein n=1 Tax=Cynoglossus semilaevis TaxID=244447 RepID=A0A3P8WN78_CYNSE